MPGWLSRLLHCDSFDRSTCRCFWKLRVCFVKIKSLFCFLLISGKQVNLSTPLRSEPTWAVTGMNWQVFTLTDYGRKRSWSWSCVKWINLKVRNDDIGRRKYASIAKLSAIFSPRGLCMKGNRKIIVVRGQIEDLLRLFSDPIVVYCLFYVCD